MELNLVDRGNYLGCHERGKVVGQEVGNADRADLACAVKLDHRAPGLAVDLIPILKLNLVCGPVNEVEIEIVEPELLKRLVERRESGLVAAALVPDLAGDEDVLARNSALCDRLADADLVAVDSRGVDVAIACRESRLDRIYSSLAVGSLPRSIKTSSSCTTC